ncbi:MAG: glucose-6-phosphate isomerase, partial [Solirubrobacteraceae bacterium]
EAFAAELAAEGYTDAVLLGMGGASLAPEFLRVGFGERRHDRMRLQVLDSTDAGAVLAVQRSISLDHTIFVVSTKSGTTIETMSLYEHFWSLQPRGGQYVAITDPGSSLAMLASDRGFRRTFLNDADVGGRYGALTFFGLVPAALMGIDVQRLLDGAGVAAETCAGYRPSHDNIGLWLGAALGALALAGRDKLTFVVDDAIVSFGIWAEQLVAESTGKQGNGVLPIAGEPVGAPDVYGEDRIFAYLRDAENPDERLDEAIRALADSDEPTLTLTAAGPEDLGRIFFFAEFATAVAGWALGTNPFDQPNVQEAKDATTRVLDAIGDGGAAVEPDDADDNALCALLSVEPPAYVAILAYIAPSDRVDKAVAELRVAVRDPTRAATTFGYGPRYLHTTGQYHKGGPKTGSFLVLVHDGLDELDIPTRPFGFNALKNAQAFGDLEMLRAHGLPAQKLRLSRDAHPADAIQALTARVRGLLAGG